MVFVLIATVVAQALAAVSVRGTRLGAPADLSFRILHDEHIARVETGTIPEEFVSKGICCGKNYSAAWDHDGDLLALAIDNVLCEEAFEELWLKPFFDLHGKTEPVLKRARGENVYDGRMQNYDGMFPGRVEERYLNRQRKTSHCVHRNCCRKCPFKFSISAAASHRPFK